MILMMLSNNRFCGGCSLLEIGKFTRCSPFLHPPHLSPHSAHFSMSKVISEDVLTSVTDRSVYFSSAHSCGNLFLDPDTGICLESKRGVRAPKYLFLGELVRLVGERDDLAVGDEDVDLGLVRRRVEAAQQRDAVHVLRLLERVQHVVVIDDYSLVDRAYKRIVEESRLPSTRFLRLGAN